MYIYKFTHIESGRSYIGQTIQDPNRRRLEHVCHSNHSPKTYHFHNALNLYSIDAFTFEVIANAESLEELNSLETKYINQFDSINNGFNIRDGGGNKLHSEESKERMRAAQRAAHARRRQQNGGVEKTKLRTQVVKSWKWTDEQKQKFKAMLKQKKQGAPV
jgi:group I intron endonuclease